MVRPDDAMVLRDKHTAAVPLRAITADGGTLISTHEGRLPLDGISREASLAHVMPGLQTNLVSLGQLCNDGLDIVLTRDDLRAYPSGTITTTTTSRPVIGGARNWLTGMWDILLQPASAAAISSSDGNAGACTNCGNAFIARVDDPMAMVNNIVAARDMQQLADWYHRALFSPRKSTLLKAISKGHFRSWPGLTKQLIEKYLQPSVNTALGHMKKIRQGLRSTKRTPFAAWAMTPEEEANDMFEPSWEGMEAGAMYTTFVEASAVTAKLYGDTSGPFPITSAKGNRYFRITYVVDANAIIVIPMRDRANASMQASWTELKERLAKSGIPTKLYVLDNEMSKDMRITLTLDQMDWQLVPPGNHRANAAERAIQTWKDHFLAGLASVDSNFIMQQYDELIAQSEDTLNMMRTSRQHPHLSAYEHMKRVHDYNSVPFAPPGIKVVIHKRAEERASFGYRGEIGFVVGPAPEHYRCLRVYVPKTNDIRISDTLEFFPEGYEAPVMSSAERATMALHDLAAALRDKSTTIPLEFLGSPEMQALKQIGDMLAAMTKAAAKPTQQPSSAESSRTTRVEPAPRQNSRVEVTEASSTRVPEATKDRTPAHNDSQSSAQLSPRVESDPVATTRVPTKPVFMEVEQPKDAGVPVKQRTRELKAAARQKARQEKQATAERAKVDLEAQRKVAAEPRAYPGDGKRVPAPATGRYNTRSTEGAANMAKVMGMARIEETEAHGHQQFVATVNSVVQEAAPATDRAPTRLSGALQYMIAKEEYFLVRNKTDDTVTVHPQANHVHCEKTGRILQYRDLIQRENKIMWEDAMCRELGRLAQGWEEEGIKGTETIHFIYHSEVPQGRKATYVRPVCDIREHKKEKHRVRVTVGGNLIEYPDDVTTKTADLITIKCHWNSVLSTDGAKYMTMDVKDFYLNTPMSRYEYIRIPTAMIPQKFMDKYGLHDKVHNGAVYAEVRKGMYGLPQAGKIANDRLVEHLGEYGYKPVPRTAGLWKHETRELSFTLVVDDFGVKYEKEEDARHLEEALSKLYHVTTDWDGKLYVGVTLDWDYDKRHLHCSMPGYIEAMLHRFQHPKPSRPQDQPFPSAIPTYGKSSQIIKPTEQLPLLPEDEQITLPQIVGVLLYYAIAVDSTLLTALNALSLQAGRMTKETAKQITQVLDYCASNPDAVATFEASDMILYIHSDASYMSESKARSRFGGFFFLGPTSIDGKSMPNPNAPVHVNCKLLKLVAASSFEAELGGLFHNAQDGEYIRTILEEMGHPQPTTMMITDNQAANNIANDIGKQKRSRAIDMRFYWIQDRIKMGHFHVFWRPGSENLADYWTKHHPTAHHREMRPVILNSKPRVKFSGVVNCAMTESRSSPSHRHLHPRGCVDTRCDQGTYADILRMRGSTSEQRQRASNGHSMSR